MLQLPCRQDAVLVDQGGCIHEEAVESGSDSSAWMALPLYIFTVVFVVCPADLYGGAELCYAIQRIWGDLEIYAGQLQKYSGTCIPEYICGIAEAGIYQYDSDRFDWLSVRVFHGKAAGAQKEKGTASVSLRLSG